MNLRDRSLEFVSTVIHGFPNNTISQKLLIFEAWSIELKMHIFEQIIDIRNKPVQL